MNKKSIHAITEEVTDLLIEKNHDYGNASFDLGLIGNMVHLWDKIKRYRFLVEENKNPNFESIDDTLKDVIGYAIIGLHILRNPEV